MPEGSCGVTDHSVPVSYSGTPPTAELGTGLQICEIACDSDEEFFQDSGSDVDETIRAIDFIMTRVTTIYERDANVTFQITATVVRPTDNVYSATDPSNLLGQFRNEWRSNFNFVTADLAHLFTGKDLDGSVIGVAFVGGVCNSSLKFGLSQSRFTTTVTARVQLTAHEIGHNFNAGHCDGNGDCRIMCASLGGCTGIGTSFGTGSASVISNFAASRSCLQDLSPPLTLPVFDNFESTTLDGDIWISSQGIRINGDASGEPSGVRSLEFSRNGTGQAVNDFVISNKVLLGGLPLVEVRCEVQPVGAPALSFIILEVLDVNREWVALDGAGASGFNTPFQEISAVLPQSALHDEAQFRIRSVFANGTVGGGRWFVDDFQIMESDCGQVVPYCIAAPNSVSLGGATVTSVGSTSITANDLQLLGFDLPTGSFAIWIYGEEQIQTALGDGFLCVNGPTIFRLAVVQSDSLGINLLTLDQGSLAPGSSIVANQTVNFQAWYRDAVGAGFNLTNALSVTFCP